MDREAALDEFAERLKRAWSAETASVWSAENPARGQCSVTALAAQHLFGGELLKTRTPQGPHFYNRIGGAKRDFTAAQFDSPIAYEDAPADRGEALADTSSAQLEALLRALGAKE